MAKTAAERQKEYRAKRPFAGEDGNGERRLNTWTSTRAALALDRLAEYYGVTKRKMIERLVVAEEERLLKGIKLDSPEGERYLAGKWLRSNDTWAELAELLMRVTSQRHRDREAASGQVGPRMGASGRHQGRLTLPFCLPSTSTYLLTYLPTYLGRAGRPRSNQHTKQLQEYFPEAPAAGRAPPSPRPFEKKWASGEVGRSRKMGAIAPL